MPLPHYFRADWIQPSRQVLETDVCVYGGTAGGMVAAIVAARRGRRVVLLQPGQHLGGMTTGGLGHTDWGKKHVIGGVAREFYRQVGRHYGEPEVWQFEPRVAAKVLTGWLSGADVVIRLNQFLERVEMDGKSIASITMLGGLTVRAKAYIDATYEGDLMAAANVRFAVGRESNGVYGETLNGAQVQKYHQFSCRVDPYVTPGEPGSGTLRHVNGHDAIIGEGDHRVQAYCFRVCMTDDAKIRVPWARPQGFDRGEYELAARWYACPDKGPYNESLSEGGQIRKFDRLHVRHKTDTNNHGPVSSDYIGANYDWPTGSYERREELFQAHRIYQQGFYWFMANDPSIPARYREAYSRWGLAGDEFIDTDHWPHQLYVREARRMISDWVMTEADCMHKKACDDPVGMGSYNLDSHNCQRIVRNGQVMNDGDVQVPPAGPYGISYRSIVPSRGQCENLAVPVCCAASHIAYGSVRMEPVFMILGESSAIAIDLALDEGCALQDVTYDALKPELLKAGQVVTRPADATGE
jgi:hypothetical protein